MQKWLYGSMYASIQNKKDVEDSNHVSEIVSKTLFNSQDFFMYHQKLFMPKKSLSISSII